MSYTLFDEPTNSLEAAREAACACVQAAQGVRDAIHSPNWWETDCTKLVEELQSSVATAQPLVRQEKRQLRGYKLPEKMGGCLAQSYHELGVDLASKTLQACLPYSLNEPLPDTRRPIITADLCDRRSRIGDELEDLNFDHEDVERRIRHECTLAVRAADCQSSNPNEDPSDAGAPERHRDGLLETTPEQQGIRSGNRDPAASQSAQIPTQFKQFLHEALAHFDKPHDSQLSLEMKRNIIMAHWYDSGIKHAEIRDRWWGDGLSPKFGDQQAKAKAADEVKMFVKRGYEKIEKL